jgi:hypothetical protein
MPARKRLDGGIPYSATGAYDNYFHTISPVDINIARFASR